MKSGVGFCTHRADLFVGNDAVGTGAQLRGVKADVCPDCLRQNGLQYMFARADDEVTTTLALPRIKMPLSPSLGCIEYWAECVRRARNRAWDLDLNDFCRRIAIDRLRWVVASCIAISLVGVNGIAHRSC